MDSDISTDPSDYTDYSDPDDDLTLSTDNSHHIHSEKPVAFNSDKPCLTNRMNHTNNKQDTNNNEKKYSIPYSIESINKSIDAVLTSLSVQNIKPLPLKKEDINNNINNNFNNNNNGSHDIKIKKYDKESSTDEYSDDESTYSYSSYYSSDESYSDNHYSPKDVKLESLDEISTNNNNHNTSKQKKTKKRIYTKDTFMDIPKCSQCNETFFYHTDFRKHMNEMHKMEKPYICPKCPDNGKQKQYANISGLKVHIKRDHEKWRAGKCPICQREFFEQRSLEKHIKVHENKPFEPIQCQECNERFLNHPLYRTHMNEIHKIEKPYICQRCPDNADRPSYRSKGGLNKHIQRDHEMIRRFQCEFCSKAFYEKQIWEKHQRVHDGKKPFKCNLCGMGFTQKTAQKHHVRAVHLKQKNYECKYCGKKFAALTTMKYHVVSQHDDEKYTRFECRTCHKRFYGKSMYYKHIDNAHRPKDLKKEMIKRGECIYPECNKKYTGNKCAESVKYHLATFHKDRGYANYECKKCQRLFYDKTSHRKHMINKHDSKYNKRIKK